jgi:hypothetical protein
MHPEFRLHDLTNMGGQGAGIKRAAASVPEIIFGGQPASRMAEGLVPARARSRELLGVES